MITDDCGDAIELLDCAGTPFAAYHYELWGLQSEPSNDFAGIETQGTSLVNSTLANAIVAQQRLSYAGYVYDPESNLYYCSARYYDPATRQWTTADAAKADGEESAYQYCGGDPVSEVDPTGLSHGSPWTLRSFTRELIFKETGILGQGDSIWVRFAWDWQTTGAAVRDWSQTLVSKKGAHDYKMLGWAWTIEAKATPGPSYVLIWFRVTGLQEDYYVSFDTHLYVQLWAGWQTKINNDHAIGFLDGRKVNDSGVQGSWRIVD